MLPKSLFDRWSPRNQSELRARHCGFCGISDVAVEFGLRRLCFGSLPRIFVSILVAESNHSQATATTNFSSLLKRAQAGSPDAGLPSCWRLGPVRGRAGRLAAACGSLSLTFTSASKSRRRISTLWQEHQVGPFLGVPEERLARRA